MRKFLLKSAILFAILIVIDTSIGFGCRYLVNNASGGDTQKLNSIAHDIDAPILIFGSSRASHHYDPRIISDSIDNEVYNLGRDGYGIIYFYGIYQLIRQRYKPDVIIYEAYQPFDLSKNDNTRFVYPLKSFFDKPGIDSIFCNVDYSEQLKMMSQMRRYNKRLFQLILDLHNPPINDFMGFEPLHQVLDSKPAEHPLNKSYDPIKLYYIRKLINDTKADGTKLVFAVSPEYHGVDRAEYVAPIVTLAQENGIPFLWFDDIFRHQNKMFADESHLNSTGAREYSKIFANNLKKLLIVSHDSVSVHESPQQF